MSQLSLFKDQEDFVKTVTKEDVINVIGTKGSGKTTSSIPYISDDDYIVINCDRLLELPTTEKEDKELSKIRDFLKKKYSSISEDNFGDCYNDIIEYILSKNKKALIEGNIIQDIDPKLLRGKIIIKRTGVFKSFVRAVKRDYQNEYFMNLEKEKHKFFYKITRFYKITKRRKNVFKQSKDIEKIMDYFDQ